MIRSRFRSPVTILYVEEGLSHPSRIYAQNIRAGFVHRVPGGRGAGGGGGGGGGGALTLPGLRYGMFYCRGGWSLLVDKKSRAIFGSWAGSRTVGLSGGEVAWLADCVDRSWGCQQTIQWGSGRRSLV